MTGEIPAAINRANSGAVAEIQSAAATADTSPLSPIKLIIKQDVRRIGTMLGNISLGSLAAKAGIDAYWGIDNVAVKPYLVRKEVFQKGQSDLEIILELLGQEGYAARIEQAAERQTAGKPLTVSQVVEKTPLTRADRLGEKTVRDIGKDYAEMLTTCWGTNRELPMSDKIGPQAPDTALLLARREASFLVSNALREVLSMLGQANYAFRISQAVYCKVYGNPAAATVSQ